MKHFQHKEIEELFFADEDVTKMEFDPVNKRLKIFLTGCSELTQPRIDYGKGHLLFTDWDYISNDIWDGSKWIPIDNPLGEPFKDLLEYKFDNGTVELESFARDIPGWIRWKMENPKMSGEFDENPDNH